MTARDPVGVPLDAPGTGTRIFRITNLRVNASAVTPGAAGNPPIQANISISGPISVPLNNPTQIVGFLAAGVSALAGNTARAESSIDFRYLFYGEDDNRTQVLNPEIYYQQSLGEKGQLGLLLSYDSISGASPTGGVPTLDATASASSSGTIPMAEYTDTRKAAGITLSRRLGSHLPSVNLSYSKESDYVARPLPGGLLGDVRQAFHPALWIRKNLG
jgi:hypothetical protein